MRLAMTLSALAKLAAMETNIDRSFRRDCGATPLIESSVRSAAFQNRPIAGGKSNMVVLNPAVSESDLMSNPTGTIGLCCFLFLFSCVSETQEYSICLIDYKRKLHISRIIRRNAARRIANVIRSSRCRHA